MDADEVARCAGWVEGGTGVGVNPADEDDLAAELDRRGIAYTRTLEDGDLSNWSPIESKGVRPKVVHFKRIDAAKA